MDPITQGILGATASQAVWHSQTNVVTRGTIAQVTILGLLTAMTPDIDVFIASASDPLMFLEYHRHFTHSLLFIPIGSCITALCFYFVMSYVFAKKITRLSFKTTWLYTFVAYATHALLDACTSYGTQLLWPFSDKRIAWSNMSIIDPLYTLPIITCVVAALVQKQKCWTYLAVFWVFAYPLLGVLQRERAEVVAYELAHSRGHDPIRIDMKPSLGNLLLWKSIYAVDMRLYVDAVRVGMHPRIYQGNSIEKLPALENVSAIYPWLDSESQQAKDIERFRWFSQGFIAQDPDYPLHIMDMRYSALPHQIRALWGIKLDASAPVDQHASYEVYVERRRGIWGEFWLMMLGR